MYNLPTIIAVSYEPLMSGETLVVLAVKHYNKVSNLQAVLPMPRHKIPSDQVATIFAMNELEIDDYKMNLPIPAHWKD
jgi:hypothetical protein